MVESAGAARRRGWNWYEAVALLVVLGLLGILLVAFIVFVRDLGSHGPSCASNLKQIGLACQAWASAHNQQWPYAYSKESERWDQVGNTRSAKGEDLGEKVPVNSNTASLWALSKAGLVESPAVFICPHAEVKYSIDDISDATTSPVRDFRSGLNCAYSFQNVFQGNVATSSPQANEPSATGTVAIDGAASPGTWNLSHSHPDNSSAAAARYTLTNSASPNLAVAADANPMRRDFWSGAPGGVKNGVTDKYLATKPDFQVPGWGPVDGAWDLNSPNHAFKGQNVLYLDGHVEWVTHPFAGGSYDNIWTAQKGHLAGESPPTEEFSAPNFYDVKTLQAYTNTASYNGTNALKGGLRNDSFLVP